MTASPLCAWLIFDVRQKKYMILAFESKFVGCGDAMDGEILQVCFDTVPNITAEDERRTPYVVVSRNFEFPGGPTIEWHDGQNYDGGGKITSMKLSRARILIELDRGLSFEVTFRIDDEKFVQVTDYLTRIVDSRVSYCE